MKVLIITNLGLGESATLPERNLIKDLSLKGVEITVLAQSPNADLHNIELPGIRILYQHISKKFDLSAIRRIRSLIKEEKFDILHFMFSKAITNGLIASIGLKVKLIGYLGSLSVHWHDPFAWLSFLNPRLDRLICVSEGVKEHVIKQLLPGQRHKITRIYKGSDPEWFRGVIPRRRNELGIPADAFVICSVANLRKSKGITWLIEAAHFLPENLPLWFLLVGNKTDSQYLRNMINKTRYPNNFITAGYSKEPNSFTSVCDLYIQPSLNEGLPKTVIEAMCLGKTVIVTSGGGAKELINEGISGYVIPAGSPASIAEIISKCYLNRNSLGVMGKAGMERIRNDFSHKATVESTYKLYQELSRNQ